METKFIIKIGKSRRNKKWYFIIIKQYKKCHYQQISPKVKQKVLKFAKILKTLKFPKKCHKSSD